MSQRVPLILAVAAIAIGAATCGKDETPAPAPIATPVATPAPTPVAIVPLSDLRASVPEFRGWTKGEIVAQEGTAQEPSAHVGATFTRGTEKLDLEIADTGGAQRAIESLESMAGSTTNRTVANGYFKGTTIAGLPAVESWNTVDKIGELTVLIRRRFIIHVAGSGLRDAAPMRALAEAVDTSRLR